MIAFPQGPVIPAWVSGHHQQVCGGAVLEAGHAEEATRRPGGSIEDRGGIEAGPGQLFELVVDDAVAEHSPGIGAD